MRAASLLAEHPRLLSPLSPFPLQLFTFAAYAVVTAGAAMLQKRANNLPLWDGLTAEQTKATRAVYDDVFQSTTYIIPYPQRPAYQFQYQWWIIEVGGRAWLQAWRGSGTFSPPRESLLQALAGPHLLLSAHA